MSRGPGDIARAAREIIEGMKGEPLDEEIADVMTDAIWDAFTEGGMAAKRKRRTDRRSPGTGSDDEGGRNE